MSEVMKSIESSATTNLAAAVAALSVNPVATPVVTPTAAPEPVQAPEAVSAPKKRGPKPKTGKVAKEPKVKKVKAAKVAKEPKVKKVAGEKATCTFTHTGTGCDNKVIALGLCPSHYRQQNRGKKLKPLRKVRDLVRLPMVIRIEKETMATLRERVDNKEAISLYDATRQALEFGVASWVEKPLQKMQKLVAAVETMTADPKTLKNVDSELVDALTKASNAAAKVIAKLVVVGAPTP